MALDGLIFDLDGTLVDTNFLHVQAWRQALEEHGFSVPADRLYLEIGKGGDKLVQALIGSNADREIGDSLRKMQPMRFAKIADSQGVKTFEGAAALLSLARRKGLKTALATGSGGEPLKAICRQTKIDWPTLVDAVVKSEDVQQSKPSPDPVSAAAKAMGLSAAQCALVGDTPYDAESARRAGAVCIGVESGGYTELDLRNAGARAVWKSPAALAADLNNALYQASPGSARFTIELQMRLIREALTVAKAGLEAGEAPIGCIIARGDGTVVATGFNSLNATGDRTAHAEMVAFRHAAGKVPVDCRDLILVSTLEPCVMCLGAAIESSIDTVLFAMKAPADSGTLRLESPRSPGVFMPRIAGGVLADESRELFRQFLAKPDLQASQAAYVRQLLAEDES